MARAEEQAADHQAELVEDIAGCTRDPVRYCEYAWPWAESPELKEGLRKWQRQILDTIGRHLRSRERFQPLRIAVASGHGIGKSSLVAMVIGWAMSTCEDCRVTLTANTEPQLRTKTWPEVLKWTRGAINSHWFNLGATGIMVRDKARERLWRTDCIAWSENNTEAFSGLHNQGKRIVVIFDEASAISDKIWEVTEGALTDIDTEIIWLAFGNPTLNTGRFRECFGRSKHRWLTYQIDSRNVAGTNRAQIEQWIADYGEDSDFVRVRVKGEFPRAGSSQFIDSESVAKCRKYKAEGFAELPKILAVDVARYGDDQTVIGCRQGRRFEILLKIRGLSTVQVAERVIELIERNDFGQRGRNYDAWVVDGDGLGAGVVDQLEHRGYKDRLFEFHGGEAAQDHAAYFNRRAEIWGLMREALRAGMEIPDDPEIETDLTGVQYGFSSKAQLQLEKKEELKRRGLSSPDIGDCLAMTFAVKIASRRQPKATTEYVYPGQRALAWMNGLAAFPMAGNAHPNHIKPELALIAFVMVGLYLCFDAAHRAGIWPLKSSSLYGGRNIRISLASARISSVTRSVIALPFRLVLGIRAAVDFASVLEAFSVPLALIGCLCRSALEAIGSILGRVVVVPHVGSVGDTFFFLGHKN